MNLLAIECSTEYLSLALEAEGVLLDYHQHAGQRHAEQVFGEINALLARAGIVIKDLEGIAFGCGPGSFTGLRIACGVTQGLAYAIGAKVKGVVTLEALAEEAYRACGADKVIACTDARMGEVYHAAYQREGSGWLQIRAPGVCKPERVPAPAGVGWTGCGSGFAEYREALLAIHPDLLAVRDDLMPTARAELALARPVFQAGGGLDPREAVPLYIRDNVARKKSEQ